MPEGSPGPAESDVSFPEPLVPDKPGTPEAGEILKGEWRSLIIVRRHSIYDNRQPADYDSPTAEEKQTLGHLTPEGRTAAAERTRERVDAILDAGEDVDFMVITSPTHWMGHEELGQRADETGQIVSQTISEELAARGGNPTRLINTSDNIHGDLTRQHRGIEEARLFNDRQFTAFMRERYGGQGREFWDAVNADTHRELRESLGAEGPEDVAARVQRTIDLIARFGEYYEHRNPGRRLATFIITHQEDLEPYAQRRLGVAPADFQPGYNDGLEIAIDRKSVV